MGAPPLVVTQRKSAAIRITNPLTKVKKTVQL
jgi:hypothetical protein